MKVIGAGLPRTATLAQRVFLEASGVGQCYHMTRVWEDLGQVRYWVDAFEGRPQWSAVFRDFQATVDWPGSFFWRELMVAYPDAKIILSTRDAESWAASIQSTIWSALFGDTVMRDLSAARARVVPEWAQYRELMMAMWQKSGLLASSEETFDSGAVAKAMLAYNDEVRQTVPNDRLLVWTPADGWEKLCEFLEIPVHVPEIPMVNTEAMFVQRTCKASLDSLNQWYAELAEKS
jgi:hypothetical protein